MMERFTDRKELLVVRFAGIEEGLLSAVHVAEDGEAETVVEALPAYGASRAVVQYHIRCAVPAIAPIRFWIGRFFSRIAFRPEAIRGKGVLITGCSAAAARK